MPQIYDMGPTALLPLRKKACWGFFGPKNPTASGGFETANLGTKGQHATSRPPKPLVYEIMWKNILQRGRPQMAIWRMRTACWIPKATDTHSKYVNTLSSPFILKIVATDPFLTLTPTYQSTRCSNSHHNPHKKKINQSRYKPEVPKGRGSVRSTRGLGPTMTARGQSVGILIGMLPQTLIMSITVQKTSKYLLTYSMEQGPSWEAS